MHFTLYNSVRKFQALWSTFRNVDYFDNVSIITQKLSEISKYASIKVLYPKVSNYLSLEGLYYKNFGVILLPLRLVTEK